MEEGDNILGGQQVNPVSATPQNVSPQPTASSVQSRSEYPNTSAQRPVVRSTTHYQFDPPLQSQLPSLPQFTTQQTTSTTDDLVLPHTQSKKSKKWIAITTIAFIAASAFTIIFFNLGIFHNDISSSRDDYQEAFNRYANLVIYGTDSVDPIQGNYEENSSYAMNSFVTQKTTPEKSAYFEKLFQFWNNYYDQFQNSNYFNNTESAIYHYTILLNDSLNFLAEINSFSELERGDIFEMFIFNDESDARNEVSEYYNDKLYNIDNPLFNQYVELVIMYDYSIIDEFVIYKDHGCIKDRTLDNECVFLLGNSGFEEYTQVYRQEIGFEQDIFSMVYSNYDHILRWTYLLSDFLNNGDRNYLNGDIYEE